MSEREGDSEFFRMDADGSNVINLTNDTRQQGSPSLSPDESMIAYAMSRGRTNTDVFLMNVDGTESRQITDGSGFDHAPNWMPDSETLIFMSNREGNYEIYLMDLQGENLVNLTNNEADEGSPRAFLPQDED
jgi:TolB protein